MRGRELVGSNLRRLRIERDISQERLAFDSGVDRSYLGGMERGEENPTVDILDRVAATLSVPVGELFLPIEGKVPKGLRRGRKPSNA
ncbi:helix-turn-helix domain-containing protein [Sphingomonas sp. BT-65]|uniref:helix-turn-helix domain-containing protein n=1 Tax=Sphingomonas sp. BT-65 TaxID=2989821 RepID=UPI00223602E0|nr:helix-turn-helix transcriptional regulator [Sphingomonas sp. BT-65]MCW4463105.1 helix-turn-helix domain-containing protein [Sphingomonas sp. BT-65]